MVCFHCLVLNPQLGPNFMWHIDNIVPPFELLQSVNLRYLLLKTALVKQMGDLQVLSVSPSCLQFGPNNSKVVLKPRHGYVPKSFRSLRFLPQMRTRSWILVCPVRALKIYLERSASFRELDQLFVCFGIGSPLDNYAGQAQPLLVWPAARGLLLLVPWALQCPWQVWFSRPPTIAQHGWIHSPYAS